MHKVLKKNLQKTETPNQKKVTRENTDNKPCFKCTHTTEPEFKEIQILKLKTFLITEIKTIKNYYSMTKK